MGKWTGAALSAAILAGVLVSGTSSPAGAIPDPATVTTFAPAGGGDMIDIASVPGGDVWFTSIVDDHSVIGRVTEDGTITELPLPDDTTRFLVAGSDGNIWFGSAAGIGRLTPAGDITVFPTADRPWPGRMALGPDGNVWFGDGSKLSRITPAGTIDTFATPSAEFVGSLTVGPDGNIWYTKPSYPYPGTIGRMSTAGAVVEFVAPENIQGPIVAGPDGNVWFSRTSTIGRITPSGTFLADLPLPDHPYQSRASWLRGMTHGADGSTWVTMDTPRMAEQSIARVSANGAFTEVVVPTGFNSLNGLVAAAVTAEGDVWFVDFPVPIVGRVSVAQGTTTSLSLPESVPQGSPMTVSVSVGGLSQGPTPTGTVDLTVDGVPVAQLTLAGGRAQYTATLPPGDHFVHARYEGDELHQSSVSFTTRMTVARPTVLTAKPVVVGRNPTAPPFTLSATLRYTDGVLSTQFRVDMLDSNGQLLCTATDELLGPYGWYGTGTASCNLQEDPHKVARLVAGGGYTAVFRGDASRVASKGFGPLVG